MPGKRSWYVVYTRPRHEIKVEAHLLSSGFSYYLPMIREKKQWSDRKKIINRPLIPGYVFVYVTEKERLQVLNFSSIVRCLSDPLGRPAVIPDEQMENLKLFIRQEYEYRVIEGIPVGTKVRVKEGPFRDVVGVICEAPSGTSLAVAIELLNRQVVAYFTDESVVEVLR